MAPATVRRTYTILEQLLGAAVERGLLGVNPVRGAKLPRVVQNEARFLTPTELEHLACVIEPVDASTLVAELLRERGRTLLVRLELQVMVSEHAWDETDRGLERRATALRERIGSAAVDELLAAAREVVRDRFVSSRLQSIQGTKQTLALRCATRVTGRR